jgi:hypothetical protein
MFTKAQFSKELEKAVSQGQKARDLFQMLAIDAVEFFHADGPSRNDSGRIQLLLLASERVQMINTSALALFFKSFAPLHINDEYGVQFDKQKAGKLTEEQRLEMVAAAQTTPFWSFRKNVEKKPSQFDPKSYTQRMVIELVKKGGLNQEQIIAMVNASFHAEKFIAATKQVVKMEDVHPVVDDEAVVAE